MNHCIDCGRLVTRGRTHTHGDAVRCLLCMNKRVMRAWRYQSAVTKLRLKVKELEKAQ